MARSTSIACLLLAAVAGLVAVCAPGLPVRPVRAEEGDGDPAAPAAMRVSVPKAFLRHDDGDSFVILWPQRAETVRILGIDTPETQHLEHDIPYAQPFGEKAAGFLEGALAVATRVEIVRAVDEDPYGRTLAYLYLDGRNYSVLVLQAGLAVETVSHFGDNGLPEPAAEVLAAAGDAGPVPFEPPYRYRARMQEVAAHLKARGRYPRGASDEGTGGGR